MRADATVTKRCPLCGEEITIEWCDDGVHFFIERIWRACSCAVCFNQHGDVLVIADIPDEETLRSIEPLEDDMDEAERVGQPRFHQGPPR